MQAECKIVHVLVAIATRIAVATIILIVLHNEITLFVCLFVCYVCLCCLLIFCLFVMFMLFVSYVCLFVLFIFIYCNHHALHIHIYQSHYKT